MASGAVANSGSALSPDLDDDDDEEDDDEENEWTHGDPLLESMHPQSDKDSTHVIPFHDFAAKYSGARQSQPSSSSQSGYDQRIAFGDGDEHGGRNRDASTQRIAFKCDATLTTASKSRALNPWTLEYFETKEPLKGSDTEKTETTFQFGNLVKQPETDVPPMRTTPIAPTASTSVAWVEDSKSGMILFVPDSFEVPRPNGRLKRRPLRSQIGHKGIEIVGHARSQNRINIVENLAAREPRKEPRWRWIGACLLLGCRRTESLASKMSPHRRPPRTNRVPGYRRSLEIVLKYPDSR